METVEAIREFIDFAAEYHFNALVLYLEWRIRTNTFDPGEDKGYTPAEIKEIVEYARKRNIEVIPGFAFFGHAEQVLYKKEFEHLAELQGEMSGRELHAQKHVFCLSNPEVRKFIESYLMETAELFSSSYIHAGFDEALDVGYCPKCAPAVETFDSEQKLVLDHLLFCHGVITGKLNKKMMIWNDLLPFYPTFLSAMPRDIVLVNWQYHMNVTNFYAYYGNLTYVDALKEYERHGFEHLAAPADFSWCNVETSTSNALNYHPLGGLLTAWSKNVILLYRTFPLIAATGLLWNGEAKSGKEAYTQAVHAIFGTVDHVFVDALYQYHCCAYCPDYIQHPSALMQFTLFGPDEYVLSAAGLVADVLESYRNRFPADSLQGRIIADIIDDNRLRHLSLRSKRAAFRMLHALDGESLTEIAGEVKTAFEPLIARGIRFRQHYDRENFTKARDKWISSLETFGKNLADSPGIMRVMFCIPLTYGNTLTSIKLIENGNEIEVARGIFKNAIGYGDFVSHFERYFFLSEAIRPDTLKIETNGYSGEGICHIAVISGGVRYVPAAVKSVTGVVEHPEHLLSADDSFCYFGSQNAFATAADRKKGETINGAELILKIED